MNFTFIDLFSGVGGFHAAAQAMGGRCVLACEIDAKARQVYHANYGVEPTTDITELRGSVLEGWAERVGPVDVLCAGFPCQPFSKAGPSRGFEDERSQVFWELVRVIDALKPRSFLLENVPGLLQMDGGQVFATVLEALDKLQGYTINWGQLDARDYGLPQSRKRLFFVGRQAPWGFEWPQKTSMVPLVDFLEDDLNIGDRWWLEPQVAADNRQHIAGGKEYFRPSVWKREFNQQKRQTGHDIWRVNPWSPAICASDKAGDILVNGERRMTTRERYNLQGFPPDFAYHETESVAMRQIGNAVPVWLAGAVMWELAHQTPEWGGDGVWEDEGWESYGVAEVSEVSEDQRV